MIHIEHMKKVELYWDKKVRRVHRYAIVEGDSPQELIAFGISHGLTEKEVRKTLKFGPVPQFQISGKALRELEADEPPEKISAPIKKPRAPSVRGSHKRLFRGVHQRSIGCWRAIIVYGGKANHVGCFKTPEEAARAYDKAAKEVWGDRAILNFPNEK